MEFMFIQYPGGKLEVRLRAHPLVPHGSKAVDSLMRHDHDREWSADAVSQEGKVQFSVDGCANPAEALLQLAVAIERKAS